MTRKLSKFLSVVSLVAYCLLIYLCVSPTHSAAIENRLHYLKKDARIMDYENLFWEYRDRGIASFDIKFSNGKTGVFRYAKLVDGKIVFESLSEYDGYNIQGYMKYKDGSGITNIIGYYKLFNFYTVEDVLENLSAIDKVIGEMPVINRYSPSDIHKNDFLQKLPDKVRYEDDDVEVIFFKFKR